MSDVKTITRYDEAEDKLIIERVQDVEPYLEQNKREYNSVPHKQRNKYKGEFVKVASIPNVIIEQWMKEGINIFDPSPEMQKKIKEKLNSSEYQYLRTRPGRV